MHSANPGWEINNHWCVCHICGFDYRRKDMKTTWDGKNVCEADYEGRHPQELLRVPVDNMAPVGIHTGSEPAPVYADVTAVDPGNNTVPSSTFNTDIL